MIWGGGVTPTTSMLMGVRTFCYIVRFICRDDCEEHQDRCLVAYETSMRESTFGQIMLNLAKIEITAPICTTKVIEEYQNDPYEIQQDTSFFVKNRGAESLLIGNIPSTKALIVVRAHKMKNTQLHPFSYFWYFKNRMDLRTNSKILLRQLFTVVRMASNTPYSVSTLTTSFAVTLLHAHIP
jgi:hypothetical protein